MAHSGSVHAARRLGVGGISPTTPPNHAPSACKKKQTPNHKTMTKAQQEEILKAAEQVIVALEFLRSHDRDTVMKYQYRPTICPQTGRAQQSFHPQPQERRNRRKELVAYRKKQSRKLQEAIHNACTAPTMKEVQDFRFGIPQ